MDTLDTRVQPHLSLDRVSNNTELRELIECSICHGILWYPIACKNCDKPFCLTCIQALRTTKSELMCPNCKSPYIERTCPPGHIRVLATLKVSCCYKSNGCTDILLYNEIEKHEETCDYQLLHCIGCEQEIVKKDFDRHKNQCPLLLITCNQCLTSYKRKDEDLHTLTECLRIQVQEEKLKTKQLKTQLSEQEIKIDLMEQKLKENNQFWMTFFETTNQIKNMLNESNELFTNSDQIKLMD